MRLAPWPFGRSPNVTLKLVGDAFYSAGAVALAVDERQAAWEADLLLGDEAALWNY